MGPRDKREDDNLWGGRDADMLLWPELSPPVIPAGAGMTERFESLQLVFWIPPTDQNSPLPIPYSLFPTACCSTPTTTLWRRRPPTTGFNDLSFSRVLRDVARVRLDRGVGLAVRCRGFRPAPE